MFGVENMSTKLSLDGQFTFGELQQHPKVLEYFHFPRSAISQLEWLADVIEHKKKIGRQIRKDEEFAKEKLIILFLKFIGYANYKGIDVQVAITTSYPGFCIYCSKKRCKCTGARIARPINRVLITVDPDLTISVSDFQRKDWKVYPNNKEREAKLVRAMHNGEEGDEFLIEFLRGSDKSKITEEVTDFLERMISLASTFEIDLGKEIAIFLNNR